MQIYDRIRKLCSENSITVTGLEKTLGFARGSLCKIDKNKPSSERVQKIADYFSVPVSYILTGEVQDADYYTNAEMAKVAQKLFTNKEMRLLFSEAEDSTPENIMLAYEMLRRLKHG